LHVILLSLVNLYSNQQLQILPLSLKQYKAFDIDSKQSDFFESIHTWESKFFLDSVSVVGRADESLVKLLFDVERIQFMV
jgi:hypothetical protein